MSEPQRNLTEDALEVGEGRARERLEGSVPEMASEAELRAALEKAFDYRSDVTITRKDGSRRLRERWRFLPPPYRSAEGYVFDRRSGRDPYPRTTPVCAYEAHIVLNSAC